MQTLCSISSLLVYDFSSLSFLIHASDNFVVFHSVHPRYSYHSLSALHVKCLYTLFVRLISSRGLGPIKCHTPRTALYLTFPYHLSLIIGIECRRKGEITSLKILATSQAFKYVCILHSER